LFLAGGLLSGGVARAQGAAAAPDRIAALARELATGDLGRREAADRELEAICLRAGRPGAGEERRAVAQALIEVLGAELPASAKVWLIRRLGLIGQYEAVRPLEVYLAPGQPRELRDAALEAIAINPTTPALRALRNALEKADGELKGAVMRALGARRDLLSVGPILDIARGGDAELQRIAFASLADIGERSALDTFTQTIDQKSGGERDELLELYVRYAYRLQENGEGGAARRIFLRLLELGGRWRIAGIIGLGKTGIPSEAPVVLGALDDADPALRAAALEALTTLRGALDGIFKRLESAPAPLQAALLEVLARRDDAGSSPLLLAAVDKAIASKDAAVQIAAVEVLAKVRGEAAATRLIVLLDSDSPAAQAAALRALQDPAREVPGEALLRTYHQSRSPAAKAHLLKAILRRGDAGAQEILAAAAGDEAAAVRRAAYQAIGERAAPEHVELLIVGLGKETDPAALRAVFSALKGYRDDTTTRTLLELATDPARPAELRAGLVEVLGERQHPRRLPFLLAAARSPEAAIRRAAIAALGKSGDAAAEPVLVEAARGGDPEAQGLALDGLLGIADAKASKDAASALASYLLVLRQAKQSAVKSRALRGVGEVGGPETLETLRAYFSDEALKRDAGRAALRVAERLGESERERAIAVLQQLLDLDLDNATFRQTVNRLRRLGVPVDPAKKRGVVTRWWILGPFPSADLQAWVKALDPEKAPDLKTSLAVGGASRSWKRHASDDPRGIVDLLAAVEAADGLGAFLYAEIRVAEDIEAALLIGSDDQVHCWLDGRKVHAFTGNRGVDLDQDRVPAALAKGTHRILLAVTNDGGPWAGVLRITDKAGKPAAFETVD
jgi:HEAT repeat protein